MAILSVLGIYPSAFRYFEVGGIKRMIKMSSDFFWSLDMMRGGVETWIRQHLYSETRGSESECDEWFIVCSPSTTWLECSRVKYWVSELSLVFRMTKLIPRYNFFGEKMSNKNISDVTGIAREHCNSIRCYTYIPCINYLQNPFQSCRKHTCEQNVLKAISILKPLKLVIRIPTEMHAKFTFQLLSPTQGLRYLIFSLSLVSSKLN